MIHLKYFLIIVWRLLNVIPIPAAVVCLYARKTDEKTTHYGQPDIQRFVLPWWLEWAGTPDEHLPGAMYEPTVKKLYDKFGWYWTSVYWIGWRNPGNGIVWDDGREVPKKIKVMTEAEMAEHGVWRKTKVWGRLKVMYGWETVRDWYGTKTPKGEDGFGGWWAVPHFTVRLADKGAKID